MRLQQIGLVTDRQALTPAALEVDGVIRLYVGIPDADFTASIYAIDVNPLDPSEVLAMGEEPVLGAGDSDGLIPAYATPATLWTSAFIRTPTYPFKMGIGFTSLETRASIIWGGPQKIMGGICFCRGQTYLAKGDEFRVVQGKLHPVYRIHHGVSGPCVMACQGDEYRIGKPHVWHDGVYRMLCTAYRRPDNHSYLVYAVSPDGQAWRRHELEITGDVFPSPIYAYRCGGWVFFNGNGRGEGGVGYGRLHD